MSDPRDPDPVRPDIPEMTADQVVSDARAPGAPAPGATRRGALMLGALATSAVVTIRPALAQAAGSVLNCEIPVPDPARAGNWIDAEGRLVPVNTPGAFAPAARPYSGEAVKAALRGGNLPGANASQSRAYLKYIRRLQQGQSGFTCYASLQMPRG